MFQSSPENNRVSRLRILIREALRWPALVSVAFIILLSSCSIERHYEVLTFFFDGVPKPGEPLETEREVSSQFIVETESREYTRQRMIPHKPYKDGDCSSTCHPKEAAFYLGENFDRRGLCFQCHEHDPFNEKLAGYQFIHGPLVVNTCLVCHDAHESIYESLVVGPDPRKPPDPQLCYSCHERHEIIGGRGHESLEEEKCLPCHDPHGGEVKFFLRGDAKP